MAAMDSMTHQQSDDVAWIPRDQPLPDICVLTGESATRRVTCLFHHRESTFSSGSQPIDTAISLALFYISSVPKAVLRLPVSSEVAFRRRVGLVLTVLLVLTAVVTCCGLYFGQLWIYDLPKSPRRDWLNDFGIPLLAISGFAVIATLMFVIHKIMPMLTVSLKVVDITPSHIGLLGTHSDFRKALPSR